MTTSTPVVFLPGAETSVAAYAEGRASLREIVEGGEAALPDQPCHLDDRGRLRHLPMLSHPVVLAGLATRTLIR
ncbi:hypothetical protein [Nocardioides bigeumensis]|uniref:Uncharacterized protein n=1 Tax=Nocardioides bigeumensis TaxID=433657 RepID=A0ABN2YV50_9ACTN